VGRIHCCVVYLVLVLFLLTGSHTAFGGKKAPQLAETIDLPPTFGAVDKEYYFRCSSLRFIGTHIYGPVHDAGIICEIFGREVWGRGRACING